MGLFKAKAVKSAGSRFFRPYEGSKPFFFVSYKHTDSDFVLDAITPLRNENYRLWYDEGIPAGQDWTKCIKEHMDAASAVLFFMSDGALKSDNCFLEIASAAKDDKPIYVVPMNKSEIPPLWKEKLEKSEIIEPSDDGAELAQRVERCEMINNLCKGSVSDYPAFVAPKPPVLRYIIIAVAAAISIVLGIGSYMRAAAPAIAEPKISAVVAEAPEPTPAPIGGIIKTTLSIRPEQVKLGVSLELKKYDTISFDDLSEIKALRFLGSNTLSENDIVSIENGGYCQNGVEIKGKGEIENLDFFGILPNLETLVLINQPIRSLSVGTYTVGTSSLGGSLYSLKYLSLAGCSDLETLANMGEMPRLETLCLEHSGVRDLTPLSAYKTLRRVSVSSDQFPLEIPTNANFEVILVK